MGLELFRAVWCLFRASAIILCCVASGVVLGNGNEGYARFRIFLVGDIDVHHIEFTSMPHSLSFIGIAFTV